MYIQGASAFARIELNRLDTREFIYAQLPKKLYRELGLQQGEKVFVRPRNMRVFVGDYPI